MPCLAFPPPPRKRGASTLRGTGGLGHRRGARPARRLGRRAVIRLAHYRTRGGRSGGKAGGLMYVSRVVPLLRTMRPPLRWRAALQRFASNHPIPTLLEKVTHVHLAHDGGNQRRGNATAVQGAQERAHAQHVRIDERGSSGIRYLCSNLTQD